MPRKKTKKQIKRAAEKRERKRQEQMHHELRSADKAARKKTVMSHRGEVILDKTSSPKAKKRNRRNGHSLRVGGR